MSTACSPLHAPFYANHATFGPAEVLENVRLAERTYRMRIAAPAMAERITPGQFLMVRIAGWNDPLLGRPFALYDVVRDSSGQAMAVDFVYLVGGKLTTALARMQPGQTVEAWGPLGNGFPAETNCDALVMVAGGIGQTPFLAYGKQQLNDDLGLATPKNVILCYGVRTAALLAGEQDFRSAGIDLRIASDDGSVGRHGLVTELLTEALAETACSRQLVVTCGPEPMMQRVAEICHTAGVRCLASLETPMACGIGICFTCVAKVKQPDGAWDYKRTCVEGPVFDAELIEW